MFRKKMREAAPTLWIATSDLPVTPAHSFYQQLDAVLAACHFGEAVRRLAAPFYEMDTRQGGQPGIDPEVYFKMLMVGFFENLASERAKGAVRRLVLDSGVPALRADGADAAPLELHGDSAAARA